MRAVSSRHQFSAMGCVVTVGGASPPEISAIERLFAIREQLFSRFMPNSELNRVNATAGQRTKISPAFSEMVQVALRAKRESEGLVDPAMGGPLEAAGYDVDFDALQDRHEPPEPIPATLGEIIVDDDSILVPAGVRLDLNGVVKGRTVDDALVLIDGDGWVSAGGDLATRGELVVQLPVKGKVTLIRGALATSGTDRRRWVSGGRTQHHLIDPRTLRPSTSPWEQVTVCGASCVGADVAAKAAFLLGRRGPAWLDVQSIPGRFVSVNGISANRAWSGSQKEVSSCI